MSRRRKSLTIDLERLFAADAFLREQDEFWRGRGYLCTGARLWRRRDGSFTVRFVWRNRAVVVSTITLSTTVTFTTRGLAL